MNNKALQPYLWILVSGFAFSWMVTLTSLAGRGIPWQVIAVVRCAIPLFLLTLWVKWDGARLVVFGSPALWLRSLAGSCSLICTFYALGSGMKTTDFFTVANTFPIWVALLSWPMLGRFPTGPVWVSIVSSIVGVAILQGTEIRTGDFNVFVVVAVSIFTAIAMLGLNRLQHIDPRAIVAHFSGTALVVSTIAMLVVPIRDTREPFNEMHALELIGVGINATIGQYCLTRAFTAGDPARVSVASLTQFVFVLVLDIWVLDNPLQGHKLWGIPLILGPTIWLMTRRIATTTHIDPTSPPHIHSDDPSPAACADSAEKSA